MTTAKISDLLATLEPVSAIDGVFGPAGALARAFPGYQPRPGQIAFARAVADAISRRGHLVAECPTGTGKSLGYLVPAVQVRDPSGPIVVVTANIALQEQLVKKDLPQVQEHVRSDFTFALMKGISNYACRRDTATAEIDVPHDLVRDVKRISAWVRETATGDKSELDFEPPGRAWMRFATSSDDCDGSKCRFYKQNDCFGVAARDEARNANVIVCNYHMFFTAVRYSGFHAKGMLRQPSVVIFDEAHKASDIARAFFGDELTAGAIVRLAAGTPNRGRLEKRAHAFFDALAAHARDRGVRLRRPDAVPDWNKLMEALQAAGDHHDATAEELESRAEETGDDELEAQALMASRKAERAFHAAGFVQQAMTLEDKGSVYFVEEKKTRRGKIPQLVSRLVDVAPTLKSRVFDRIPTVVCTSATLQTKGGFDYFIRDIGIPEPQTLEVPSPFEFHRQALLVAPKTSNPNDQAYPAELEAVVLDAIEYADGRTLALFTSHKDLDAAYHAAVGEFEGRYTLLKQGEGGLSRTQLLEAFREDERSVLFGTESFWAGVDVQGPSLSCVVISRLPFKPPDDPVIAALGEAVCVPGSTEPDWWDHSLAQAIVQFRQGFGRLIRSVEDRGVVVCVDPRIVYMKYGRDFLAALPEIYKSRDLEDVRRFLSAPPSGSGGGEAKPLTAADRLRLRRGLQPRRVPAGWQERWEAEG